MDMGIDWDPAQFRGDWALTSGDLGIDQGGLRSAVLLSLFTDQLASDDYQTPAGSPPDRRGWWGDTYEAIPTGSRLWQLNRVAKSAGNALLQKASDYCTEALQWLVNSGVVASVSVQCSWLNAATIGISVTLTQPNGAQQNFIFGWAWQGT